MTGFNLPENFKENPEDFFRSVRPRVVVPQKTLPTDKPAIPAPPTFKTMADKTFREFVAPSAENVAIGPQINIGDVDFDLKSSLITMAHASPFYGKPNEDANTHLQQFLEICSTYTIKGVSQEAVRLRLFPFSLLGRAKQWFYANRAAVNIWDKCSTTFLLKFFPIGKTNAHRGRISSFQQTRDESIPEA
uniref:OSJNBa0059H15.3 protein n=1 Tax=Oryza sativa subsp. japonica TaxID=39947 RepID=Q7X8D7_ORYSJ|nr:OSJNBa0059H15.3 [Oryza sativa Japonica Group]